jgi:hypothetical protein
LIEWTPSAYAFLGTPIIERFAHPQKKNAAAKPPIVYANAVLKKRDIPAMPSQSIPCCIELQNLQKKLQITL